MIARHVAGLVFGPAALGGSAAAADRDAVAWRVAREHGLLTRRRLACAYSLAREDGTRRLIKVGFYEKHDQRCGGDPSTAHRLFDLEIDARTGHARWDCGDAAAMRPVPRRAGPAAR